VLLTPNAATVGVRCATCRTISAFKEEIRNLSPEKRAKACEETGDRWLSEGRCAEAVTAFQAMIDAERELGESPAGLGNSYLRLARALVGTDRRAPSIDHP
jgi:hypothetical protein